MRVMKLVTSSLLLAGFCALPALAQQQQQQQSGDPVADAARRSREQQKAAPKPKKVYTDDDVKPASSATTAPATSDANGSQAQAAPDATQASQAPGGAPKSDEATAWRKRFADQRAKIATAEKELDVLQRESNKSQVQYYNDPTKALMEQNSRKDINDKKAKIDQKQQEITNLKQQLSDLEDELRKSGGDPGWAR
jgi:chromosome segregation ATPase